MDIFAKSLVLVKCFKYFINRKFLSPQPALALKNSRPSQKWVGRSKLDSHMDWFFFKLTAF